MTDTNVFALAQIIKAAGSDPRNVTDVVWAAGYRKPERSAEEAVMRACVHRAGSKLNEASQ